MSFNALISRRKRVAILNLIESMQPPKSSLSEFLKRVIEWIVGTFSKASIPGPVPVVVQPTTPSQPTPPIVEIPSDVIKIPNSIASSSFMVCPIQANDANGQPVTPFTAKIASVIDHSDTTIDPTSKKGWGLHAKDQKVIAFNSEVGDGESSAVAPFGYTKKTLSPFFAGKEINYVGAVGGGDAYGPTFYLNYDGHAGYDFAYGSMTPILAPADGTLHKATNADDNVYGQGWEIHHTFYIKHSNGFSTWFRHCTKLADDIEAVLLNDYSKSYPVTQGQVVAYVGNFGKVPFHLHFETKNSSGKIVDPYGDKLWV